MIIIGVKGGLGNQMQQYALYRKLLDIGRDALLDLSWFDRENQAKMLAPRRCELLDFVDLPLEECTPEEREELLGSESRVAKLFARAAKKLQGLHGSEDESLHNVGGSGHSGRNGGRYGNVTGHHFVESKMYHPEIFQMDDVYIDGYFACTKYYEDILGELQKLFRFPRSADSSVNEKNAETIQEMEDAYTFSCAVHIRRGDYLDEANAPLLCGICTEDYYRGAVEFLENAVGAMASGRFIHFYLFSDDPDFARHVRLGTQGENITVCDWNTGEDSMLDMMLMKHCNGVIAANSTFSFWGGRLNTRQPRILIRPLRHRNNQIPDPDVMREYWKGWTLVDRDGTVV